MLIQKRTRYDEILDSLKAMNFFIPGPEQAQVAMQSGVMPSGAQFADASGQIFTARELEQVEARAYQVLYQDLKWRQLFPIDNSVNEGAKTTSYQIMDKSGKSRWINTGAKDIPRVDVAGDEVINRLHWGANAYGYNIGELASARFTGTNLDAAKASAARRAHEELMNTTVWNGNADLGFVGIFSSGNGIPRTTVPTGVGGVTWDLKTPDEILADVNLGFSKVVEDTLEAELPTHMLLPTAQYNDIATRRVTDTAETILSFLVRSSPWIAGPDRIVSVPDLKDAGTAGVDDALIYTRNPEKIETVIPKDITFMPVQQIGLEYVVNCVIVFGGLRIRYPLSAHLLEGI
jgi:hypothetical protein